MVELDARSVRRLDARTHAGENIGETPTDVVLVELEKRAPGAEPGALGPR